MAQDDNKPSKTQASSEPSGETASETDLPEVEAEIVNDGDAAESAFEDDPVLHAQKDDLWEKDDGAPARSRTFTPGVILFLLFTVVALAAFVVWRMQVGAAPTQNTPVEAVLPENVAPGDEEASAASSLEPLEDGADPSSSKITNLPDPLKRPDERAYSESASEDSVAKEGVATVEDDKIINTLDDNLKRVPASEDESVSSGNNPYKEYMAKQEKTVPDGITDPVAQESPPEEQGEVTALLPDAEAVDTSDIAATPPTQKIENQAADLKSAIETETQALTSMLESERQHNKGQAAEIEALRQELAAMRAAYEKIQNEDVAKPMEQIKAGLSLDVLKQAVDQG